MRPSSPQATGADAISTGAPPATGARRSFPPAKKATARPSSEKNECFAPPLPATRGPRRHRARQKQLRRHGAAAGRVGEHVTIRDRRHGRHLFAGRQRDRQSHERGWCGGPGEPANRCSPRNQRKAPARRPRAVAVRPRSAPTGGLPATSPRPASASSISRRASAADSSRRLRSFSRHRRSSLRIGTGVFAGSVVQSTSSFNTGGEYVGHRFAVETRDALSASPAAPRRTPRGRSACRPACPPPVQDPCTRPCQG